MVKVFCQWLKANSVILINAGSLIGTSVITSLLGFVYWWFAARYFAPDIVGLANAIISAMTFLGTLGTLGFGTLLVGELPIQRGKEFSLIITALLLVGFVGVCLGIGYALLAPYLSTAFEVLGANVVNIALFASGVGLTAITFVLDQAIIGMLRGELQLWRNTFFAATKLVALFAVGFWLSHITGLTIYATWMIGNLCSLAVLAGFVVVKRGGARKGYRPQWSFLRKFGTTALRHHLLNMTIGAPYLILPVLITVILSATMNAQFYIAWNLASIGNTISTALATTLYAVSAAQPSTRVHKLRMTMLLTVTTCVLITVPLFFDTGQVLGLFGHSYSVQAAWSLRILSLESFPFIIKNYYSLLSRIHNRVGHTTLLSVGTGVLELGASTIGALLGGVNGLSLGWSVAICIEAIYMFPTIYRALRGTEPFPHIPVEAGRREEEEIWMIDTIVLTAIRPETAHTGVLIYQHRTRGMENIRRNSFPQRRPPLHATRLMPLSPNGEASVISVQENKVNRSSNSCSSF